MKDAVNQKAVLSNHNKSSYNPNSPAGKFFGLDSYLNMHKANTEGLFTDIKNNNTSCMSFSVENICDSFLEGCSNLVNIFKKLSPNNGCARVTFSGSCFEGAFHTVGIVRNKDNLYILDSLGNNAKVKTELLDFHKYINFLISINKNKQGLNKIIINHNTQQNIDELTCNHWTFANIESLIKALKSGKKVPNSEVLDKILPKNINRVLDEHFSSVVDYFKNHA